MTDGLAGHRHERGADPLDEQRHLVADLADIAATGGQYRHRGAIDVIAAS